MAIAPMGVIKAGAAYQPLDPTYPRDRLMYMMEDSSAKLLIADRELLSLVDGYKGPVLFTDQIWQLEDRDVVLKKPQLHDLFILLYTSGSQVCQRAVCWNMEILLLSVTGSRDIMA